MTARISHQKNLVQWCYVQLKCGGKLVVEVKDGEVRYPMIAVEHPVKWSVVHHRASVFSFVTCPLAFLSQLDVPASDARRKNLPAGACA